MERSLADRDERVTKAEAIAADTRGTAEVSLAGLVGLGDIYSIGDTVDELS